jgi:hypothetical protein
MFEAMSENVLGKRSNRRSLMPNIRCKLGRGIYEPRGAVRRDKPKRLGGPQCTPPTAQRLLNLAAPHRLRSTMSTTNPLATDCLRGAYERLGGQLHSVEQEWNTLRDVPPSKNIVRLLYDNMLIAIDNVLSSGIMLAQLLTAAAR